MGEFTGSNGNVDSHQAQAASDMDIRSDKFATEVPGVYADAFKQVGTERVPIFSVDQESFHQNLEHGRKRIRFPEDTAAHNYIKNAKYNKPFYISYTDPNNKEVWTRKIG